MLALGFGMLLGFCAPAAGAPEPLTIGILDTSLNPYDAMALRETIEHLQNALPNHRLRTVTIPTAEAPGALAAHRPDFLFAPAGFAAQLKTETGTDAFRIATRRKLIHASAEETVGAVFVRLRGSPSGDLESLRGLRAATAMPNAVDGWLAAEGEIQREGYDPEKFFAEVRFLNNAFPDVLAALAARTVDVAILPACLIETLAADGLLDLRDLEVVHRKAHPEGTPQVCAHSTALYPDISLLAMPGAPERAVRQVTVALLSDEDHTSGFSQCEWLTNVSEQQVDALFRTLREGPYRYLRDMSPSALFERYRTPILAVLGILLLLVLNEFRLRRIIRERTASWFASQREAEALRQEAESARLRLAGFERRTIVEQLSGMIAHEVNTPVGTIRAYAGALKRFLARSAESGNASITRALEGIDREASRIAGIIQRVRDHARTEATHTSCNLLDIRRRTIRAFIVEAPAVRGNMIREEKTAADPITVVGDALELELLMLNLLRNASHAVLRDGLLPQDAIRITCAQTQDGGAVLLVENEGKHLSDETLEALRNPVGSPREASAQPSEGLGLGLSICRAIAESHAAAITFEARPKGGLRVVVRFPQAARPSSAQHEEQA